MEINLDSEIVRTVSNDSDVTFLKELDSDVLTAFSMTGTVVTSIELFSPLDLEEV